LGGKAAQAIASFNPLEYEFEHLEASVFDIG